MKKREFLDLMEPTERIDEIGFSGFRLIQRPEEFCYGIDAVLLSDFVKVKKGGRICDLGTGTGIIPLILRHKTEACEIWGVELQRSSFDLALRNVELNGLQDCVHMLHADVKEAPSRLGRESFDVVVSNPPYVAMGAGLPCQDRPRYVARHETESSLRDFIQAAALLLKERGSFYLVHRPHRLADILTGCRENRLEPKQLRMVAPRRGEPANIVLLQCVKYGKPELAVLPELSVYEDNGRYTEEVLRIYEKKKQE